MSGKTVKKQEKASFLNVPRSWTYLIGYEYQTINKHGEPKLTKGQKPVLRKIDHADLLLLDEIRGFSERGNKECFEEAVALARAVGLIGQEQQVCDKVLQLCGIGFIKATRKVSEGKIVPQVILTVDSQLVNDAAEARRESMFEQQRIHSQQADFCSLLKENNRLQEYLQEYLQKQTQEQLPEDLPEYRQEQVQENLPKPVPEDLQEQSQEDLPPNSVLPPMAVKHLPPTDGPLVSDPISKDFDILDGETNADISFECLRRVNALKAAVSQEWAELIDWVNMFYGKRYQRLSGDIKGILWGTGACHVNDTEVSEMIAVANYLLDGIRSDPDLEQHVHKVAHLKPLIRTSDVTKKGSEAIDKTSTAC